jgi:tetratricopeptide (TPR) repeat protein
MAYFEALAAAKEQSDEWRALSAGLVTLRLFDAWIEEGESIVASSSLSLKAVREAIAAIETRHSVRSLLTSIVDAMVATGKRDLTTVAPRLIAYGRALQLDGQWPIAADVFRTVVTYARPIDEPDLYTTANMQLGASLRLCADWTGALAAYRTAGDVALMCGDTTTALRSRVGEANVARDRGNLPLAETLLDEAIRSAQSAGLTDICTAALHERAAVAHRRGNFELAVQLGHDALQDASGIQRDEILADMAASFYELGARSVARDVHLIIAATSQSQFKRWQSVINLLEIAAIDGSEPAFEQYRRELASAQLPAMLAAYYHLYLGQGYRMFSRASQARTEIERAISIASANQLNQVIIEAEMALDQIRDGGVVIIGERTEKAPSAAIEPAVRTIRNLRELAGVS